jgi:hypothetical protein
VQEKAQVVEYEKQLPRKLTAMLFSAAGSRSLKAQVDSVLRTVVGKPHFFPILRPVLTPAVAFSPDGQRLVSDSVCQKVWRNLTLEEWHKFVGIELPYERTCPNLPRHPSLFESAAKLVRENDMVGADRAT